jgi:hypothetical protein
MWLEGGGRDGGNGDGIAESVEDLGRIFFRAVRRDVVINHLYDNEIVAEYTDAPGTQLRHAKVRS